ncbi:Ysc84 domain-containing protein [Nitrospira tepida]|uniref:Ysc84 domain-containing protein n=2 Tax=Nitrospira tepida TaxID=2973512 RepID=A0AA86MZS3_9BACT|nr:Ysc84 domain-containing protein [Nitrospira tepida]
MIVEQQKHRGTHRRQMRSMRLGLGAVALTIQALMIAPPSYAADFAEQQQLVDKARLTIEAFAADPSVGGPIRELKSEAKALFIVPQFVRGAFVFGGAGGSGVLLVRDEKTGDWSEPAFYTIGSASFGLQIGGDVSEMVLVVRTQKGLEEFYRTDFKLGADVSMAVGPEGEGVSVRGIAADILSYARKKGIFAGISAEGAIIAVSNESNRAYYGKDVRPTDIVVKRSVSNPKSADLRKTVEKMMK